jgi:hypothetical protein
VGVSEDLQVQGSRYPHSSTGQVQVEEWKEKT